MAIVLDQAVGLLNQLDERLLAGAGLEVEFDAALVAVHHHEGGRFAVNVRRQEAAGIVAIGPLHLDHVRAHVGQHQPGNRTGHDVGQLDDLHALKRAGIGDVLMVCHFMSSPRCKPGSMQRSLQMHKGVDSGFRRNDGAVASRTVVSISN
jgi:hypothetical protein